MFAAVNGSILVFLPGLPEIRKLTRLLQSYDVAPRGAPTLKVMQLHGSLSAQEQSRVFSPPGMGILKVVLSTNVAEASVTIPDVDVVIDSCLVKEIDFDADTQVRVFSLDASFDTYSLRLSYQITIFSQKDITEQRVMLNCFA